MKMNLLRQRIFLGIEKVFAPLPRQQMLKYQYVITCHIKIILITCMYIYYNIYIFYFYILTSNNVSIC